MDFITSPLVSGIVFYFIYRIFELFVRKDERLRLIEQLGRGQTPFDATFLQRLSNSLLPSFPRKSFTSLRFGSLFVGLGLGLFVGLFLSVNLKASRIHIGHYEETYYSVAYTASILFFGGLGLIVSYLLERKSTKKEGGE